MSLSPFPFVFLFQEKICPMFRSWGTEECLPPTDTLIFSHLPQILPNSPPHTRNSIYPQNLPPPLTLSFRILHPTPPHIPPAPYSQDFSPHTPQNSNLPGYAHTSCTPNPESPIPPLHASHNPQSTHAPRPHASTLPSPNTHILNSWEDSHV